MRKRSDEEKQFIESIDRLLSGEEVEGFEDMSCLLYTSPSPRDRTRSRMPSSA